MTDNFTSTKASDLIKTTGRALNAEQRLQRAEALLATWFPEFKLMYINGDANQPVLQAKINGKVTVLPIAEHLLQQADPAALAKSCAELLAQKFAAAMIPYISVEAVKAISNYAVATKIDGGKL